MQTIFPMLRYDDARTAIRWLCSAFGFVELFSVPQSGATVRHAQLKLGTGIIMVGTTRPNDGLVTPRAVGVATQAISVYVPDIDAHYERARHAGAQPDGPPKATDFGSREYHVRP